AAPAEEPALGARRDDREVWLPPADRAVPVIPVSEIDALRQGFGAARQEWPQRQDEHLVQTGRRVCRRTLLRVRPRLDARGRLVPSADQLLEGVAVPSGRQDLRAVR